MDRDITVCLDNVPLNVACPDGFGPAPDCCPGHIIHVPYFYLVAQYGFAGLAGQPLAAKTALLGSRLDGLATEWTYFLFIAHGYTLPIIIVSKNVLFG